VVIVGGPGMKGTHSLLRVVRDVLDLGVPGERVLPVVNRAPRSPRARAELARSFGDLLAMSAGSTGVPSPVHLPARRNLDELIRDGARFPEPWVAPVCGPVRALLDRDTSGRELAHASAQPVAIVPGSLGAWTEQVDDATEEGVG
jgi:hypothetical protein